MDVLRNQKVIKKYQGTNENKGKMIKNQQDAAKALLKRKFIAIKSYLRKKNLRKPNLTPKRIRKRTTKKAHTNLVEGKKSYNLEQK